MAKAKTVHVCQACGYESPRWLGKCPGCEAWNTMVEEVREAEAKAPAGRGGYGVADGNAPSRLGSVESQAQARIFSQIGELDRVLGGGFVRGGVVMLGGDPGIGKSTLSLQVAAIFASRGVEVLYVTGEESLGQIRMRAERLGVKADDIWVVSETNLGRIERLLTERKPGLAIIDSIQTTASDALTSVPGSVAQLREVTGTLTQVAKGHGIPLILVGHVTKDGAIAGPKVLEHMVDTVLYFEGQAGSNFRLLRAVKNRFGSTNEVGVFEMRGDGLSEVPNPSAAFLEGRPSGASGSAVVPILEGTRPLMVEVQALVSPPSYGPPRVTSVGVDTNRVILLLNILEKRTGIKVAGMDVFINVAGGMRVSEPAADLGISLAILSSQLDRPLPTNQAVFGEMGLTGEVRAVSMADRRVQEARKLGFSSLIVPASNAKLLDDVTAVGHVAEAVRKVFGDLRAPQDDRAKRGGPRSDGNR